MSRTRHHRGQKNAHCGEDLWSPRGGMAGATYNAYNKGLTRRKERAEAIRLILKALREEKKNGYNPVAR